MKINNITVKVFPAEKQSLSFFKRFVCKMFNIQIPKPAQQLEFAASLGDNTYFMPNDFITDSEGNMFVVKRINETDILIFPLVIGGFNHETVFNLDFTKENHFELVSRAYSEGSAK